MPALYVVQQNAKLRVSNRRLQVERETPNSGVETLHSVPLGQVSQVVLFGNIGLTTPAIDALLLQGCEVVFLTQNGEFRGRLTSQITPHVPLRRAQYARLGEPDFVLKLACCFVAAKLTHQRVLLQRHTRQSRSPEAEACLEQMEKAIESTARKTALSSLLGLEGAATAAYFGVYRTFFAPEWRFSGRNRRPPADPVNVLLSFGYTLLAQAASGAVQTVGLDPYAGYLHEIVYNRPALALDIMEEFRPVIDGLVLWCCRSGQVTPKNFSPGPPERPVILDEEGKRRFIHAYEERMGMPFTHPGRGLRFPLRQCIVEQARQTAGCILSGSPAYQGMGFR